MSQSKQCHEVNDGKEAMVKVWNLGHGSVRFLGWKFVKGSMRFIHTYLLVPKHFLVLWYSYSLNFFFFSFNVDLRWGRKRFTLPLRLLIKQKKEHGDGFCNGNAITPWLEGMWWDHGAWDKINQSSHGHVSVQLKIPHLDENVIACVGRLKPVSTVNSVKLWE